MSLKNINYNFSMVVLVHNNQEYIKRIINYYNNCGFKIIIADSSVSKYSYTETQPGFEYYYFPNDNLTGKIANVLQKVNTKFIALNGVDDFIVPEAVIKCVGFLENNIDYTSAVGNCFYFRKDSIVAKKIEYFSVYPPPYDFKIDSPDCFERLALFFSSYRTTYTGVHHTKNLVVAFNAVKGKVNNLFLNEYLHGVYSILSGKHIEIPVFYQLREYVQMSDGETTPNLDQIVGNPEFKDQYEYFLSFLSKRASAISGMPEIMSYDKIQGILMEYSSFLKNYYYAGKKTALDKIKIVIQKFPFLGPQLLIMLDRRRNRRKVKLIIRNTEERLHLEKIEEILKHTIIS